jgi:hypothetical protein
MKKISLALLLIVAVAALESCSTKLCPAYNSYPRSRRG